MRNTTRYLTALAILTLPGTALTPVLASDAPEAPQPTETPAVEIELETPVIIEMQPIDTPADAAETAQADEIITYPAPTIDLMDRTTWPAIVVTPADGKVTHNPHFMGDPPMGDDIVSPLHAPDPVWQIQEALRGADAGNWNGENLTALGVQPVIATAQILAIPFRAVIDNPLSKETSPK
ncbi:MAG: hypothetical protein R3C45_04655 [Phycisphaerales bacterium]